MTTILIDDASYEGKAFIELLKKMNFARVLGKEQENEWWNLISEEERHSINDGLSDIASGKTIPHSEMRKRYGQWL